MQLLDQVDAIEEKIQTGVIRTMRSVENLSWETFRSARKLYLGYRRFKTSQGKPQM